MKTAPMVPYGIEVRCDTRKCTLSENDLDVLALALDGIIRSGFVARTPQRTAGHQAQSSSHTTTEVLIVRNTDPDPRLDVHISYAHPNGWPSALQNLQGDILPVIDDFLDSRYPNGELLGRPKVAIRWSNTNDKWNIHYQPAPS